MNIKNTKKGIEKVMKDLQEEIETAEREDSPCFMFGIDHTYFEDHDGNESQAICLNFYRQNRNRPSDQKEYWYSSPNWKKEERTK